VGDRRSRAIQLHRLFVPALEAVPIWESEVIYHYQASLLAAVGAYRQDASAAQTLPNADARCCVGT